MTGYTCGFCGYLSTGFRDLKRHKEEKHTEEELNTPLDSDGTKVKPKAGIYIVKFCQSSLI